MWTRLHLEHFKCFERLELPLAPLTLLTGLNAAGKSTIIQAIALLNQTIRENEWGNALLLNGPSVRLGTVGDVVNDLKGRNSFKIGVESQEIRCAWSAGSDVRSSLVAHIKSTQIGEHLFELKNENRNQPEQSSHRLIPTELKDPELSQARTIAQQLRELTYISAERIGPREVYEAFSEEEERTVGVQGERTAYYLFKNHSKLTRPALTLADTPPQLPRQTEAWLARFFPGAGFRIEPVVGANLVVMSMRTHHSMDFHRPQNVGYGLTHILPIIAACLGANKGSVLLIDNPEAHLHPSGQAAIGRFLAEVASSGVQVIVETHSDHVLNGIRVAAKNKRIAAGDVAIHFFARESASGEPSVLSPEMLENGRLSDWPAGFFDEWDIALHELF